MINFDIKFSNPWMLLLLVPALLFTLIPYFRMNKRYRCTRNRITSMVLHMVIMTIAIAVFAGLTMEYDLLNKENEVILLVDSSQSGELTAEAKEEFIKAVIDSSDDKYKLGIVTFGFDQVYAVQMTDEMDSMYAAYLQAPKPDTTATNIAAALQYAASLFTNPQAARIVLMSDAVETDGKASSVIKSIAAQGIKVDTVHFPKESAEKEVQLVDMTTSVEKINVGEKFSALLTVQSAHECEVTITPYDNGVIGEAITVTLEEGLQTVEVPYLFTLPGLHKLSFELNTNEDGLAQNNYLTSYLYLEVFDDILVIESIADESKSLCNMLREELKVTVVNVHDKQKMPTTLQQLRAYDEVILCNISFDDMPEGFEEILYQYVHDVGGGLFTICGNEEDPNPYDDNWTANAYTRQDMLNSQYYKNMLPVDIIEYTPPVGVMIIIDRSGSMYDGTGPEASSKLGAAKEGAKACLDALSERDYVGIMSLGDADEEHIELTPRPQYSKILDAIEGIKGSGSTNLTDSLQAAGRKLRALSAVERRHIIIVTDGEFTDPDPTTYEQAMVENAKHGITTSIVGIQCSAGVQSKMKLILEQFAGVTKEHFHAVDNIASIGTVMRKDLEVPEIKEVNYKPFQPAITATNSVTYGVNPSDVPMLDGFYGVKLKEGAQAPLMGEYTPVYAQWTYGKGRVGTFACDLNGTWSSAFIDNAVGHTLINNIIYALFPTEDIHAPEIEMEADGDNYLTNLSIFTDLEEGQYVEISITSPPLPGETQGVVQVFAANANETYSRMSFVVKDTGIHEIKAVKRDAEGNQVGAESVIYKALSYSQEYNAFTDPEVAKALSEQLAADGKGMIVTDPWQVFENAVKYIHHVIDPRIVLIIIALVLFLLDVAVRKFKWKWPHELLHEKKLRQEIEEKKSRKGRA